MMRQFYCSWKLGHFFREPKSCCRCLYAQLAKKFVFLFAPGFVHQIHFFLVQGAILFIFLLLCAVYYFSGERSNRAQEIGHRTAVVGWITSRDRWSFFGNWESLGIHHGCLCLVDHSNFEELGTSVPSRSQNSASFLECSAAELVQSPMSLCSACVSHLSVVKNSFVKCKPWVDKQQQPHLLQLWILWLCPCLFSGAQPMCNCGYHDFRLGVFEISFQLCISAISTLVPVNLFWATAFPFRSLVCCAFVINMKSFVITLFYT
jgi:hypothetical protein